MAGAKRAARAGLSLPIILDTAIALVDRDGPHALTMRQVGRELGVEAMSLYRYVAGLDALLDAVVERVVDQLLDSPDMQVSAEDDWRTFLSAQAHGLRRLALGQPSVFPLIATHPPSAPWMRPPLRSLRWIEQFLAGLLERGFAEQGAVVAYRSYTSFLLGHLLLEVGAMGVSVGPVDEPDLHTATTPQEQPDALREQFPAVGRLAGQLAESNPDQEFAASLITLLDHLEHQNALPSPTSLG